MCSPDGDIRLAGGRYSGEGRLKICKDGGWGTICNRGWNDTDAQVVCADLSLNSDMNFQGLISFGFSVNMIPI